MSRDFADGCLGGRPRTPVARSARIRAASAASCFLSGYTFLTQSPNGTSMLAHHWMRLYKRQSSSVIRQLLQRPRSALCFATCCLAFALGGGAVPRVAPWWRNICVDGARRVTESTSCLSFPAVAAEHCTQRAAVNSGNAPSAKASFAPPRAAGIIDRTGATLAGSTRARFSR